MDPETSLSQIVKESQDLFQSCLDIPELSENDWLEQKSAEFNWWTSGLNADKTNISSLDHRLSLRPDVKDVVAGLLDGINSALSECAEIHSNGALSMASEPSSPDLPPLDHPNRAHSPYSDSDPDSESSQWEGRSSPSAFLGEAEPCLDLYMEQRYYIETNIDILLRIHTAIKRSGLKFRNKRADDALERAEEEYQLLRHRVGENTALNDSRIGEHERFRRFLTKVVLCRGYQQHLIHRMQQDIHAGGTQGLLGYDILLQTKVMIVIRAFLKDKARLTPVQRRLIDANVTRRNRFLHAGRARKTGGQTQEVQDKSTALDKMEKKTTIATWATDDSASPNRQQATDLPPPLLPVSRKGKEKADQNDSVAQSSTALGSNFTIGGAMAAVSKSTKSAATRMSARIEHLDYPKCPGDDGPFECPLCPEILPEDYNQKKRWRAHVAQDLNPYVCVFDDCPHPDEMYTSTYE
ncbi:hypothetical protein B0T10DRAFT_575574 [Thelonectria olida]|uniref:Uncharacterized protein n=1 Tax=Thelonectria olida TaxID=1576542 RepID=A0A9P9ANU3_9HYPO|nr:hypothetical protein B0T10DRAFT_575574 [Thelonectria olida]